MSLCSRLNSQLAPATAGNSKGTVARAAAYVSNKEIRKKLAELMIPTFQMERVRVKDCLRHLKRKSEELDPENVGINFFPACRRSSLNRTP